VEEEVSVRLAQHLLLGPGIRTVVPSAGRPPAGANGADCRRRRLRTRRASARAECQYANPARIYVAIYADPSDLKSGITVYGTSNSGASWSAVRNGAGSQRLALWTTLNGDLYVWNERYSGAEAESLYVSTNRGATWMDLKLPASISARVSVGISDRKVVATVNRYIYLYDTARGAFSLIGQLPNLW